MTDTFCRSLCDFLTLACASDSFLSWSVRSQTCFSSWLILVCTLCEVCEILSLASSSASRRLWSSCTLASSFEMLKKKHLEKEQPLRYKTTPPPYRSPVACGAQVNVLAQRRLNFMQQHLTLHMLGFYLLSFWLCVLLKNFPRQQLCKSFQKLVFSERTRPV